MSVYLNWINPFSLQDQTPKVLWEPNRTEMHLYRNLAGILIHLGQAVILEGFSIASKLQQFPESLYTWYFTKGNNIIRELLYLKAFILFSKRCEFKSATITMSSNTWQAGMDGIYGQSEILNPLNIYMSAKNIFLPILWSSHKKRR